MASHTPFWIAVFFYLLATKLSDAHPPPAQPQSPPAVKPPAQPQLPPAQPRSPEEFRLKVELDFLDMQKQFWVKQFGKLEMSPPINHSICFPPPAILLEGAKAMATQISKKRSATFQEPKAKAAILKALDVPTPAAGNTANIDPRVKAQIVKNLQNIIYDSSTGEHPVDLNAKVNKFVDFLASGSKTGGGGGGPPLNLAGKLRPEEIDDVRDQIAITLAGDLPGEGLKPGKGGDDLGFTKAPPMSTILPIAKCTGAPELDTDIHDLSVASLFFQARQLSPGQKLNLQFGKTKNFAAFMSPGMLDKSGTMSSFVLMDMITILTRAMDAPQQANIMFEIDTVSLCEQPATKGKNKEKCCATDLQTMMNYTQAKVGNDVFPATLSYDNEKASGGGVAPVEYTISKIEKLPAVNIVGCTKLSFSIAVFYCQALPKAVGYTVDLAGPNGVKVKAPVICHEDTTTWNPKSWIFKTLNSKPDPSTKICHFLAADDIAWMTKTQENTAG